MTGLILYNTLTMSSRDLLDVINEVRKSENEKPIRNNDFHLRVADELEDFNYETFVVQNLNKTESTIFKLTQDMCMLVAMRESKKVRRIILEKLKNRFVQTDPVQILNDPKEMRGLLLTYSEKVIALEEKVVELKPKAEALDRIAKSDGSICITNAAKDLQIRPKDLFQLLQSKKWIFRRQGSSTFTAYQDKIQQGLLEHKITVVSRSDGSEKQTEQVRVTSKGITKLSEILTVETAV